MTSRDKWLYSWRLPAIVTALVLGVMYGLVPYTFAYNAKTPVSIAEMLWMFWSGQPDWEHGSLVIPIVIGLLYWKRESLKRIPIAGDNRAIFLFLFVLLLYWVGYKGDIKPFAFFSIQLLIAALIIWYLGFPMFKAMLFPWSFLAFAWPLPGLDTQISFPLRQFMSGVTYHFLNIIGIPTLRIGTAIVSAPDFTSGLAQGQRFQLDVEDPCSGIHSLFALTMISALLGYIVLPKNWQRFIVFFSAIPLAIFGNFIRMLMLTFGTLLFGSEFAIGKADHPSNYHMGAGYMIFIAAMLGMFAIIWILQLDWKCKMEVFLRWAKRPAASRKTEL